MVKLRKTVKKVGPITLSGAEMKSVDSWIRNQKSVYSRAEAIRQLAKLALSAADVMKRAEKNNLDPFTAQLAALRLSALHDTAKLKTPQVERVPARLS